MSIRNILRGAASVFVELPPDQPPQASGGSYSQGAQLNSPAGPVQPADPLVSAFDFGQIYRVAGLVEVPLSAERIREMLSRLPRNLPQGTKRQMMREMLTTLGKPAGATIDSIIADASAKISALNTHVDDAKKKTENLTSITQTDIDDLQRQIAQKRQALEISKRELMELQARCRAECQKLAEVLDFFPQDRLS